MQEAEIARHCCSKRERRSPCVRQLPERAWRDSLDSRELGEPLYLAGYTGLVLEVLLLLPNCPGLIVRRKKVFRGSDSWIPSSLTDDTSDESGHVLGTAIRHTMQPAQRRNVPKDDAAWARLKCSKRHVAGPFAPCLIMMAYMLSSPATRRVRKPLGCTMAVSHAQSALLHRGLLLWRCLSCGHSCTYGLCHEQGRSC